MLPTFSLSLSTSAVVSWSIQRVSYMLAFRMLVTHTRAHAHEVDW